MLLRLLLLLLLLLSLQLNASIPPAFVLLTSYHLLPTSHATLRRNKGPASLALSSLYLSPPPNPHPASRI